MPRHLFEIFAPSDHFNHYLFKELLSTKCPCNILHQRKWLFEPFHVTLIKKL